MNLASDPPIAAKIARMAGWVRWRDPLMQRLGVDQTRLMLPKLPQADGAWPAWHFLVVGDSGTGRHRRHSPPRRIAERLLPHRQGAAFLLHTGDVVYLVGAAEQYRANFQRPYRDWLVDGDRWQTLPHDRMVFNQPLLPVPGNHDYYDLSAPVALLSGLSAPLRRQLGWWAEPDCGWHGSGAGGVYAAAFLDGLAGLSEAELSEHLDRHYVARWDGTRCLRYEPGAFTRLPNRYYRFRQAGVDVFALDTNTFTAPHGSREPVDQEQLDWLERGLIASWRDPGCRGRLLVCHHPAYSSEATKAPDPATLAVRHQLRRVFDAVASALAGLAGGRTPVDLVLTGHAHCLELIRCGDTGHADAGIPWLICGGSGYSLRPQGAGGGQVRERDGAGRERVVAASELFIGRGAIGPDPATRPYSALRIDVGPGAPLSLTVTPLVSERIGSGWRDHTLASLPLTTSGSL
ncbi:metallophosphoesterase [Synechococcus sp. RSCCF101]|nr:metallophosphoesterase [Synechococcus sp. RSCCF101]QEY33276.1 metallophosphoesterase [Synechococcus sp. RSCCF101]